MAKSSKSPKENTFETSKELKLLFNEQMELWRKRERAGLEELAKRCGVSPSYLAHVGRYGRIPSKPVLILLALNFEMQEPQTLLRAAGVKDPWPYERNIILGPAPADKGLLSLSLDMSGFTRAIREIVREEVKPRSVHDLLRGRPLRVGLNPLKYWMFGKEFLLPSSKTFPGFFTEFCSMLALSLKCEIVFRKVEYGDYPELFTADEIDIFGPVVSAPNMPQNTLFTSALYRVGMSALFRKIQTPELDKLPAPKSLEDLLSKPYQIAVIRNSRAHLIANTRLQKTDRELIVCSSLEEGAERVTYKGIKKPAHLFICNSVDAKHLVDNSHNTIQGLFLTKNNLLDLADSGVGVRADWPELATAINEFTGFLVRSGSLGTLFKRWKPTDSEDLLQEITNS